MSKGCSLRALSELAKGAKFEGSAGSSDISCVYCHCRHCGVIKFNEDLIVELQHMMTVGLSCALRHRGMHVIIPKPIFFDTTVVRR